MGRDITTVSSGQSCGKAIEMGEQDKALLPGRSAKENILLWDAPPPPKPEVNPPPQKRAQAIDYQLQDLNAQGQVRHMLNGTSRGERGALKLSGRNSATVDASWQRVILQETRDPL